MCQWVGEWVCERVRGERNIISRATSLAQLVEHLP